LKSWRRFVFDERMGFAVSPFECEQRTEEIVRCAYSPNSRWQQITGYPPIEADWTFTIRDRLIVQEPSGLPYSEFGSNMYEPFVRWLNAEHPGPLTPTSSRVHRTFRGSLRRLSICYPSTSTSTRSG
jgi:hypothetical protein